MLMRLVSVLSFVALAAACPQTPPDTPVIPDPGAPDSGIHIRPDIDCAAYEFQGTVYNCDAVDRCTNEDLRTALACCECDPNNCDPVTPDECPDNPPPPPPPPGTESCMQCHNGSEVNDYSGPGLSNPHPFGVVNIRCSECHGGNPGANSKILAHVPPPPQIGDRQNLQVNFEAYANRLVMSGIDKFPDYTANGTTYTAGDYLNFINPGDLRIVREGRGCGACHADHGQSVAVSSPIGTEIGFFSSATYHIGVINAVPENTGLYQDTASDYTFRGGTATNFNPANTEIGEIGRTIEVPEFAQYNGEMYNNPGLNAANLADDQYNSNLFATDPPEKNGQVRSGSDLAKLYQTQISITCGDCHAGSAGANNRYADFRSSGCTTCHMEYSPDGRSRSSDPNVPKLEPANPDAIAAPERPHIDSHQVRNVARVLPNGGGFIRGISDRACVGCHQGSNRTVLQYWGIRLDQNADLANNFQYPTNPITFVNTAADERLFDPGINNNTFNGRNANQYILDEDYDGDARDDTPPDIHYELGMGCIDCHGSRDVHAGTLGDDDSGFGGKIYSKMDQIVKIRCENCHGGIDAYPPTTTCSNYLGEPRDCLMDAASNPLRNTEVDVNGDRWLLGRVDGERHFIPATRDTISNSGVTNPLTNRALYSPLASYAMGRVNGNANDGVGPQQTNPALVAQGFSHTDNMDCTSCHASWANQCIGCHLRTQYDAQNYFFSNITGERIVQKQQNADFSYITPVPTYLGVNSKNKITQIAAGMKVFYAYIDLNGDTSQVFTFSDRNGEGNNPNLLGRNAHPSLGNYQMSPHSIRGKVTDQDEGPKYCVACHLNTDQINNFGAAYAAFVADYRARNYANIDFADLAANHFGPNPGNQLNTPFYVHATAGLGSAMYLFDANGCPVNPVDANANRFFCNGAAPADLFDVNNVAYDLDRFVEYTGVTNASSLHPMIEFPTLRDGSLNPSMSGTLGAQVINKLTNPDVAQGGKVLDSWLDANSDAQGDAANYIQ